MRIPIRGLAVAAAVFVLAPAVAWPQTEVGKVAGIVSDPSGAVLPGVTVTLKSVDRATTRSTTTNAEGAYVFANVQPGPYEVAAELSGFAPRQIRTRVSVGASVDLNISLAIGGQSETVEVVGETASAINTRTQDIATTISERQIRELPLITRNPYDLVALSGNVTPDDTSTNVRGAGFSINGQRSSGTNVLLDGASNNDEYFANVGQAVPLDSVQEFSVITSNFSAQFGRASGGVVNVATRSGTNTLRGSVYDFFRNQDLSTRSFDDKARGLPKSEFDRNAAGFSLGGPIVRDKLHFFVNGEYLRIRSQAQQVALVPTSQLVAATAANTRAFFTAFPLKDGLQVGRTVSVGEIASGFAPGGAFSSLASSFPAFQEVTYTVPVDAGGGIPRDEYQAVARVDWAINPSASAYVRYAFQDVEGEAGSQFDSPYSGFDTNFLNRNHNLLGSLTYVFSPRWTSLTKVVWTQLRNDQPLAEYPNVPTLFMRSSRTSIAGIRVAFPGYGPYDPGVGIPAGGPQKSISFIQDFNLAAGRHDIRFGGLFRRLMDDHTFGAFANPSLTLGTTVEQALNNLMAGYVYQFQSAVDPQGKFPGDTVVLPVGQPNFTRNNRYNEFALYANDTWSITPRLNLNLGLRYEYFGVQHNSDPSLDSNFYYGAGDSIFQRIRNGRVLTAPESPVGGLWNPDWNNVAPRVGFAWDATGDGRTSVRGGYGISYERNFGNVTYNVIQNPPNYATLSLVSGVDIPQAQNLISTDITGPLAGTGSKQLPRTSVRHVDEDVETAYAHFWSLSVQRQVFSDNFAEITYTGSRGVDLYSLEDPNRPGSGAIYLGDANPASRLNAQYSNLNTRGNKGKSRYHGITAGWDARRLGGTGLQLTARYTLGWAKDNLSSTFSEFDNNYNLGLLDPFDPDLDFGWADFDARHRFVAGGTWELPFAREAGGLARTLAADWSLNFIFTAQSGYPFSIFDCSNTAAGVCMRMLRVADVPGYTQTATGEPNQFVYLDFGNQASGFGSYANPTTGTSDFGPYPSNMDERNSYRRPGRWNVDASLTKRIRFGDRASMQLRFEVFNVFNHANLFVVGNQADVSDPTIYAFRGYSANLGGVVGDGQRRIQLGAKLEF